MTMVAIDTPTRVSLQARGNGDTEHQYLVNHVWFKGAKSKSRGVRQSAGCRTHVSSWSQNCSWLISSKIQLFPTDSRFSHSIYPPDSTTGASTFMLLEIIGRCGAHLPESIFLWRYPKHSFTIFHMGYTFPFESDFTTHFPTLQFHFFARNEHYSLVELELLEYCRK